MLDATFNTEMFLRFPGFVVEVCRFLASGGDAALKATEVVKEAPAAAVIARFVVDRYD